jgi:L-alanine-DL-glutamate epimerase-like enolase superfamily enzyme
MRITGLEIRTISIPLRLAYRSSKKTALSCDHVIVQMQTDVGLTGYGEGAPGMNATESPMDAIAVTLEKRLGPFLLGLDPRNLANLHVVMDKVLSANGCAKAAVDMAAYDILGKSLGIPIYALLGGKYRNQVPLNNAIGAGDVLSTKVEAEEIARQGFKVIKIKGSGNPKEDIARVRTVREVAGPNMLIRIDPNGAYAGVDVALKAFRAMEAYDLELIEQPLPRWDISGMASLCRALDTPIVADESMYTMRDAVSLYKERAADILNLKLQEAGGIYRAMQIGHFADCANIPLIIGARSETGVGQCASIHLAVSCPTVRYACDLRTPANLIEDILQNAPAIENGGVICPEGPGLGVEVNVKTLDKYTIHKTLVR